MSATPFSRFVHEQHAAGRLVVQPRMGFSTPDRMRAGLSAVKRASVAAIGTVTLDSYTRVGDHGSARAALDAQAPLNGFPIVTHGPAVTRAMLRAVQSPDFPVQVRHGSALPLEIVDAVIGAGADATEGGPISYCLPYGRTPLREAIAAWRATCEHIAEADQSGHSVHLESFGGCMLGQLCPPSLLIAISLLECIFFARHGVRSMSLSYAQQGSPTQDLAAISVLRELADRHLDGLDWHVVLYTYMGVFPRTVGGALDILAESARLAAASGAERLIVKTPAEAHRIPTVAENVSALQYAAAVYARSPRDLAPDPDLRAEIFAEATALVSAVLALDPDLGVALERAFQLGMLDVPYCLHADNANAARAHMDEQGLLRWREVGNMPIGQASARGNLRVSARVDPFEFITMLQRVERRFDQPYLEAPSVVPALPAPRPRSAPTAAARRVAIVGMGPRGLSVLEALARRLADDDDHTPVHIIAIDPYQVGAGRIWRTDQPDWFLMNTVTGQITIYSGPPDDGPWRAGAGPNLHQWLALHGGAEARAYGPNDCAPRVVYGRYLVDALDRILDNLPAFVTFEAVSASVTDIQWWGGQATLTLSDGRQLPSVSRVVLTTGHPRNQPGPAESELLRFAAAHPALSYVMGDSAADQPLDRLAPASSVGLMGLGLGFYDVVMALTVGRGGRFEGDGDELTYVASGAEPTLFAGSRSGLPIPSRGRNQKLVGARYNARFITAELARSLRAANPEGIDFNTQLLPLVQAEVALVYFRTLVRQRRGAEAEAAFADAFVAAVPRGAEAEVIAAFGVDDHEAPDLDRLARPFEGRRFNGPDEFQSEVVSLMEADLAEAHRGNVDSAHKASMDVLRDVRDTLRVAVDFGGLSPASYRDDFLGRFYPVASLLAAGPPPVRAAQALALMRAGLLRFVGPDVQFTCDPDAAAFAMASPSVADSRVQLDAIVDTRIPVTRLQADTDPLVRRLVRTGALGVYTLESGGEVFDTGGAHVTDSPFNAVNAAGEVNPRLHILGIPSETTRWFTQVGSGTPGTRARFTRDADAIAGAVLAGARAELRADALEAREQLGQEIAHAGT